MEYVKAGGVNQIPKPPGQNLSDEVLQMIVGSNERLDRATMQLSGLADRVFGCENEVGGKDVATPEPTSVIHRLRSALERQSRLLSELECEVTRLQRIA